MIKTLFASRITTRVVEDPTILGYPDILRSYLSRLSETPEPGCPPMDPREAVRYWAQTGGHRLEDTLRWAGLVA